MIKRLTAEVLGTFWLVFGGCGSAVLAAKFLLVEGSTPINLGIGLVGVALAFGLTVLSMAYAIGHVSGCHLNPAVSVGLCTAGRFPFKDLIPYVIAQVIGGVIGAAVLFTIADGSPDFKLGGFACNGYTQGSGFDHSPGHYNLTACATAEAVLTFMFLIIILGATDRRAPAGFAGIAIGLGLTLIHLVGIPITNLSVNPARSTGPAIILAMTDPWAVQQLWLFWVAPIVGAAVAGYLYRLLWEDEPPKVQPAPKLAESQSPQTP